MWRGGQATGETGEGAPCVLKALGGPPKPCDLCGVTAVRTELVRDPFIYGAGEAAVELSANVRVHTCSNCGDSYTEYDAEVAYHEAVCRHLGILTPAEIREMREGYDLTRAEFAQLTGFGKATVGRWERGEVTQNRSADRYLRLLQDREVMRQLRALAEPTDSSASRTSMRPAAPRYVFIEVPRQNDIRESCRGFTPRLGKTGLSFEFGASATA